MASSIQYKRSSHLVNSPVIDHAIFTCPVGKIARVEFASAVCTTFVNITHVTSGNTLVTTLKATNTQLYAASGFYYEAGSASTTLSAVNAIAIAGIGSSASTSSTSTVGKLYITLFPGDSIKVTSNTATNYGGYIIDMVIYLEDAAEAN